MIKMISFYKNIAFFYISKITIHNKQIQTQQNFWWNAKFIENIIKNIITVKSKNLLNFDQKIISQLL